MLRQVWRMLHSKRARTVCASTSLAIFDLWCQLGSFSANGNALALDGVADDGASAGRWRERQRGGTRRAAPSTSWPSTSTAAKLKRAICRRSGSRSWISRVGPADWILL